MKKYSLILLVLLLLLAPIRGIATTNTLQSDNKQAASKNINKATHQPEGKQHKAVDKIGKIQPRDLTGGNRYASYATKKMMTQHLQHYLDQSNAGNKLGPRAGDEVKLYIPATVRNLTFGEYSFGLQPNITIWGTKWFFVTRYEVNETNQFALAYAFEARSDSDASYRGPYSGVGDEHGDDEISVTLNSNGVISLKRLKDYDPMRVSGSQRSFTFMANLTNNYGAANNQGTAISGSNSDWRQMDAVVFDFTDQLTLNYEVETIAPFEVERKNNYKKLIQDTAFKENPVDFYRVTNKPSGSETTARWLTTPNMQKSGNQTVTLEVTNTSNGFKQVRKLDITFSIKADQTKLELEDVDMYVGQTFNPDEPFKTVTDKDGVKLSAKTVENYYIDGRLTTALDTSKPGKHQVKVTHRDASNQLRESNEATITIKKDQTKLELQDITLYVDDVFLADAPFKTVTDKDGVKLNAKTVNRYYIDGKLTQQLDTSKPGVHQVEISHKDALGQEMKSNVATVTIEKKTYDIEETFYDDTGKLLQDKKLTTVDKDDTFTPKPQNYYTKDDVFYVYKGWLEDEQKPGIDQPQTSKPPKTNIAKKYYYIYEKADNFINVTLPTEIVFGTDEGGKEVTSKAYKVTNHSKALNIALMLERFTTINSKVTLLGEKENEPTGEERTAKLNLTVNGKTAIKGLNEKVSNQRITNIESTQSIDIGINGKYFGKKTEKNIVDYQMKLKVTAISGKEE